MCCVTGYGRSYRSVIKSARKFCEDELSVRNQNNSIPKQCGIMIVPGEVGYNVGWV